MQLVGLDERQLQEHRGRNVAMVFQNPERSLNPTMKVGSQITEAVRRHLRLTGSKPMSARSNCSGWCASRRRSGASTSTRTSSPAACASGSSSRSPWPASPALLIADEATTALDVTTQAQIMDLLLDLQQQLGTALVMISHDLALAATYAEEIMVMYAGRIVEQAPAGDLFGSVRMPYTRALLDAIPRADLEPHVLLPVVGGRPPDLSTIVPGCSFAPRCPDAQQDCTQAHPSAAGARARPLVGVLASVRKGGGPVIPVTSPAEADRAAAPAGDVLLEVRNLVQEFVLRDYGGAKGGVLQAVSDVSFELRTGETLGIVGETGSGKSTLARSVIQSPPPKHGSVIFQGRNLVGLSRRADEAGAPEHADGLPGSVHVS